MIGPYDWLGLGYSNPMVNWTRHDSYGIWWDRTTLYVSQQAGGNPTRWLIGPYMFGSPTQWLIGANTFMIQGYSISRMIKHIVNMPGIPAWGWLGQAWVFVHVICLLCVCGGTLGEFTKLCAYSSSLLFQVFQMVVARRNRTHPWFYNWLDIERLIL